MEGVTHLSTPWERRLLSLKKRIFKKPANFIQETIILNSLRKNKIDVILAEYGTHAHNILPILKKTGLPLVVHFHGYDASMPTVIEKCDKYKAIFQYASKVVVVSLKMEQLLLEMGCPREKLVYNVYGPEPDFLKVQPTFLKKQFIAIGRFTDKKAPYYTILAFKKAVENHGDAKLIMAGDGHLLNICKNLVKYLDIEAQVEFPGIITPEKFRHLLAESRGLVQHSITTETGDMEGTPLSVLESSAAGLPVIATSHAGIPDVIIHEKTGLLCEEHEVDTMAKFMISLLDNVEFAKELGSAGKNNIQINFSMERHIASLQNILKSVL
ncbi:MAG: glycosyltransferase family 4 protein [Flavobacteriaceae bacterium]|nr:glycosyltransferase family 4 protein [Flavobacteriaceae bacterium]